jgi:hypothetical protein
MTSGLATASLDEFAFRLLNWQSEGWLVLVVADDLKPSDVAVKIANHLQALGMEAVALMTVTNADSLIRSVRNSQVASGTPTVSCGYERLLAEHWRQVDLARSALATNHPVGMVMSTKAFSLMQAEAPNLANWIGAAWEGVGVLPLTDKERAARLTRLRKRYKKSDAEVIALAKADRGSVDPDLVEWLILLGQDGVLG